MYKPLFNKVLVEIKVDEWGRDDQGIAGEVYREGKVIETGVFVETNDYPWHSPETLMDELQSLEGKEVMWHEGHEAGTVFEENDKKYALVFWWDLIGVKDGE